MLTLLACCYHVLMFFCIIVIENYQFGRQLEMKKAFLKMSQEHKQVLHMGAAAAHNQLINSMMLMLQEQQDAFMQCTSTFDHGLMVAFATYHAVYAAYFMHGLVTWGPYESQ